jgi:hypothetical protein
MAGENGAININAKKYRYNENINGSISWRISYGT